jgi:hypothetical protein
MWIFKEKQFRGQGRWFMFVISGVWEVEMGKITVQGQP